MSSLSSVALERVLPQSNPLDLSIIHLLENLAFMSEVRGYPVKPYTQKSLSILATFSTEKKENLFKKLQTTVNIVMAGTEIEKNNPSSDYGDRRLVEMAIDFYGYDLKDEEFWKTIRRDEFIEIYNAENIQIFRTFNFFKTSSYSILDLLINEWYQLWERPKGTLDNMFQVVSDLFSGKIQGITPVNVREHLITEIFNGEDQENFLSRSSLILFGVICPIYNKSDGQIGGLLVSAQVKPVATGEQAKSISFI